MDNDTNAIRVLAKVGLNDRNPNPKELEMARYFLTEFGHQQSIDYAANRMREQLEIR